MKAFLRPSVRSDFLRLLNEARPRMRALQPTRQGITKAIKKRLYPLALSDAARSAVRRDLRETVANEDALCSSTRTKGLTVHAHLTHAIECIKTAECELCGLKRRPKKLNPIANEILEELKRNRIYPVVSEMPIVYRSLGTRIDMIGVQQPSGRVVLISVKTGKLNSTQIGRSMFRGPIRDIPFSDENVAWVQALIEVGLCRAALGTQATPHDIYVVLGSRSVVEKRPIAQLLEAPKWARTPSLPDQLVKFLISVRSPVFRRQSRRSTTKFKVNKTTNSSLRRRSRTSRVGVMKKFRRR